VNGKTDLLSLSAIKSLNLAARLNNISSTNEIVGKLSSVFNGLGNLGEPYSIELQDDAKPHALFTARIVTFVLRPKVQQELQRKQQLGVIHHKNRLANTLVCRNG